MSALGPESPAALGPIRRTRLIAAAALLVGLAMVQDPGLLVPDTKFDLVEAPGEWLARALHLWDPEGGLGQVQNQAHGYLWPMGPFFLVLHALDVPGWVVQRLWQALVTVVAFTGLARLARSLGVRSEVACIVAGFAFALSPRLLTSLGPISIEVWPSALAPWVLIPLVRGAVAGSPRRAAAWSALAVAMAGGVNAAASFAVVPLAVVWILTRTRGPRRRALMIWWPLFTALGTFWWIVPLLVMGRYSPPFLDFTETAAVTTFPTTLFDTLRGTSHWVPYVDLDSRAGNELIRTSWLAVNTAVVVLIGLAGLLDRRTPHRTFLTLGLLSGVVLVTAGHHGAVEGWFAGGIGDLLDGALAPLRNVHKFDPVIRVPLVIGLAFALDHAVAAARRLPTARVQAGVLVGAAVLGVVGTATPAVAGRVEPGGATLGIPDYWREAARFVTKQSQGGTSLLVPGSAFADYLWGAPQDEPFEWLADTRWGVRNAGILAEPGRIRMLEGLERRFAEGHGSAGLTEALRRAGVEMLVVRNDLRVTDDIPSPALVHQALAQSPGLERVATFGPDVGVAAWERDGDRRTVNDGGRAASYPAVEVFAVPGVRNAAAVIDPTVVAAGPEDLADLADLGVLDGAPTRLLADLAPGKDAERPRRVVLTDGLRARERGFVRMHDAASATITPGDVRRTTGPTRDLVLGDNADDRWSTTAHLVGAEALSASSSASDADAPHGSDRGRLPAAAIDGSGDTAWMSGAADPDPWWQVDLTSGLRISRVTVTAPIDGGTQRMRVRTAAGESSVVRVSPGGTRRVSVPADSTTTWVRIESASSTAAGLALADVDIPGVEVRRILDLPRLPSAWGAPDVIALQADLDGRTGCVVVGRATRCAAGTTRTGEDGSVLRRSFSLAADRSYEVSGTVAPHAGSALDDLILQGQAVSVRASSTALGDPRAGAVAAVDGDAATTWMAAANDDQVDLELSWLGTRAVSGVDIDLAPSAAARRPSELRLIFWKGRRSERRQVELDASGRATFPAVQADRVEVAVTSAEDVGDVRPGGELADVPVGMGEIRFTGVPFLPLSLPSDRRTMPCGSGPELSLGSATLQTAITASPRELFEGGRLQAQPCSSDPLSLDRGRVDVTVTGSAAFDAAAVVLTATDDPGPAALRVADLDERGAVRREIHGMEAGEMVALRESANQGWRGDQAGQPLDPVVLDGWQQGFMTVTDDAVEVTYAPDRSYRLGLLVGLLLAVVLVGALVLMRRGRADSPAVADRPMPPVIGAGLGVLIGALTAGTVGVAVAVVVLVAMTVLERSARSSEAMPWTMSLPVLLVGLVYALRPWGGGDGWAGSIGWIGYLSLVPLVALAFGARPSRAEPGWAQRIAGRSTRR